MVSGIEHTKIKIWGLLYARTQFLEIDVAPAVESLALCPWAGMGVSASLPGFLISAEGSEPLCWSPSESQEQWLTVLSSATGLLSRGNPLRPPNSCLYLLFSTLP